MKRLIWICLLLAIPFLYLSQGYYGQLYFIADEELYKSELGEAINNDLSHLIDKEKTSPILLHDPYELILPKEEPLEVGTYELTLIGPKTKATIPWQVVDTTPPTLTLKKSILKLPTHHPFSKEELLDYLVVEDLSEIKEINVVEQVDWNHEGDYEIVFEVEDLYQNKASISLLLTLYRPIQPIVEDVEESESETETEIEKEEPKPFLIGPLEMLQEYGLTHRLDYFITNITLSDGTETYGLWINE